jgi:Fe2+ or Zn2+ uptake regulation protein
LRGPAPDIALATVYRSLHALEKLGLVKAVDAGTSAKRYEAVRAAHAHVRCTRCGKIEDLTLPDPEDLDHLARKQTGYDVQGHDIVFEGICPECQTQTPQS